MTKTSCQSDVVLQNYAPENVVVGSGRVDHSCVRIPYPVRTRERFAPARNQPASQVRSRPQNELSRCLSTCCLLCSSCVSAAAACRLCEVC